MFKCYICKDERPYGVLAKVHDAFYFVCKDHELSDLTKTIDSRAKDLETEIGFLLDRGLISGYVEYMSSSENYTDKINKLTKEYKELTGRHYTIWKDGTKD